MFGLSGWSATDIDNVVLIWGMGVRTGSGFYCGVNWLIWVG